MNKKGRNNLQPTQGSPAAENLRKPPAEGLCVDSQVDLKVTGLSHEGQGIGHYGSLAVFIPGALPGDQVRVKIQQIRSRYAIGRLIKLALPSPDRIVPACPQALQCGGCTLQAMAYPAQLRHKQQLVADALQRIGKIASLDGIMRPIIGMAKTWHYRSKAQFPVAGSSAQPEIGFYASSSHQVVHAPTCAVQPPVCDLIRDIVIQHIKELQIEPYQETTHTGLLRQVVIRIGFATGEVMVILVINGDSLPGQIELNKKLREKIAAHVDPDLPALHLASFCLNINKARTNLILTPEIQLLAGQSWIEEQILGLRYRISPLAFFQVNPRQTTRLYAATLELAALTGNETVLDLYCGTGSISLLLAQKAKRVIGIEVVAEAIADARVNAELNGIENVEFLTGEAEKLLPELAAAGLAADVAVVDPPRKGCDPALIRTMIELGLNRIVYVSCNPATLARDIALLQPAGYVLEAVQPVDMFPWTGHVETVVLMSREGR